MRLHIHLYTALLTVGTLLTLNAHALAVRDATSDISTTKGGVLVKNGKQTSCELGVIDSMSAFVAAPCLDFSGSTVNMNTNYEVYLDAGINNTPVKYKVNSITVHPEYNSTIFLNPIAVLEFNKGSTEIWSNQIAINQAQSWGSVLYVSRGLTDMNSMQWRTPLTSAQSYADAKACASESIIFDVNANDFVCTNATTHSPFTYLTGCAIPYGSVDAYISGKLYIAGIHTFTEMSGVSYKCTLRHFQDSMYVLFADYIAFASKILGRSVGYYPNSNGVAPQSNSGFSMNTPAYTYTYAIIESGDFYANQTDPSLDNASSSLTDGENNGQSLLDISAENPSDDSGQANDLDNGYASDSEMVSNNDGSSRNNQSTMSNKAVIIGVVFSILGGLVLTSLLLYFYKKWKRARLNQFYVFGAHNDKDTTGNIRESGISVPTFPSVCSESPPGLNSPTAINGFGKGTSEALEYYMTQVNESSSPSSLSSFSSFPSSLSSIYQNYRYS